jgi:DNA-binding IclR family transcriptional regulator
MASSVLIKAFALLEALADAAESLPLAGLSKRAHVGKPTGRRVLQSLLALGYVAQDADSSYRLTGKLRQIALGPADRWLVSAAGPALRRLHASVHETVNLGVLRRGRVFYLHVVEGAHAMGRIAGVQESDPFFTTALGRAIAANESAAVQEFLLGQMPLERHTPHTVVDITELGKILAQVRRLGYAIEQDQTDIGVTCVGAPILSHGMPVAAISVSLPTAKFTRKRKRLVEEVRKAAAAVSRAVVKFERKPS